MKRLLVKRQAFRGEITVFLSMIFVLMLSLVGGLIQSASIYINISRKRADTQLALESVFAEFHPKLWREYDILAIEGKEDSKIIKRMEYYGADFMSHQVQKKQLLSDGKGQAFYEQAIRSMGGNPPETVDFEFPQKSVDAEVKETENKLQEWLSTEKQSLPEDGNPLEIVDNIKKSRLLSTIQNKSNPISTKSIELTTLLSHRTLEAGNIKLTDTKKEGVTEKGLFLAYLLSHFQAYPADENEQVLSYELEYLLEGGGSDSENLDAVAKKILSIRMALNYGYIMTDAEKKAQADALATALTAWTLSPTAKEVVKQSILAAWAYGESIVEMRILWRGEKVPVSKTKNTWQISLEKLLQLGSYEGKGYQGTDGIGYDAYLNTFLLAANTNTLCMRALDLIEQNLDMKADCCVVAVEVESVSSLQGDIRDRFVTRYRYR